MSTPLPPCRLYVILARDAPVGVIFRRGPSKRVQLIHWDTQTDTFKLGQWFHGRIYEKLSDISPNGKLLLYAARQPSIHTLQGSDYTDYWTAISKPPYLTALALWPCHSSIGGGLFLDDTKVWLNYYGRPEPHPNHRPQGLYAYSSGEDIAQESLFNRRLEREGWKQPQNMPDIRLKPHLFHHLTLVMTIAHSSSRHHYSYGVQEGEREILFLRDAEWADWDHQGRLVYAQEGRMYTLAAEAIGREEPAELTDLNGNKPEPMVAPEWAKHW